MEIQKAIVPVAGLGTRLLPATKSQPKEMLPIGIRPIVQYVVEELVEQGITKILFVTGRNKRSIEDHFDRDPDLQSRLSEMENEDLLEDFDFDSGHVKFYYTRQIIPSGRHTPAGIGDAILMGEDFVDDDPFVVAFGDTIIRSGSHAGLLRRMIRSHEKHNSACTIAVAEVTPEEVGSYGIVRPVGRARLDFPIDGIVEKPSEAEAPSRYGVASRYVFNPEIFQALHRTSPGFKGELELTSGISTLLKMDLPVRCVRLNKEETRYDIGSPESYFRAFIDFAISDQLYGYRIRQYLQQRLREF
jgi:UTP--glucose-1-phosphate uridylyltransferase